MGWEWRRCTAAVGPEPQFSKARKKYDANPRRTKDSYIPGIGLGGGCISPKVRRFVFFFLCSFFFHFFLLEARFCDG